MDIAKIFDEVAQQMRADWNKAKNATSHPVLKGASPETAFRDFLRQYLPKSLDISSGVIVDSTGNQSRQIDVIISDVAKTPIFYKNDLMRVVPIECVYAVIEVKAHLDCTEIDNIFKNMISVRHLKKEAYYKPAGVIVYTDNLYGKEWNIWPTNYFVFAIDSIELGSLASYIDAKHKEGNLPEYQRIDCICVLNRGVICNINANGLYGALPEPNSKLFVCNTKRALLLFYALTSNYLNQARLPIFRFKDYLGQLRFGEDEIL